MAFSRSLQSNLLPIRTFQWLIKAYKFNRVIRNVISKFHVCKHIIMYASLIFYKGSKEIIISAMNFKKVDIVVEVYDVLHYTFNTLSMFC